MFETTSYTTSCNSLVKGWFYKEKPIQLEKFEWVQSYSLPSISKEKSWKFKVILKFVANQIKCILYPPAKSHYPPHLTCNSSSLTKSQTALKSNHSLNFRSLRVDILCFLGIANEARVSHCPVQKTFQDLWALKVQPKNPPSLILSPQHCHQKGLKVNTTAF